MTIGIGGILCAFFFVAQVCGGGIIIIIILGIILGGQTGFPNTILVVVGHYINI